VSQVCEEKRIKEYTWRKKEFFSIWNHQGFYMRCKSDCHGRLYDRNYQLLYDSTKPIHKRYINAIIINRIKEID